VVVVALGGTIAMSARGAGGGVAPGLDADELVAAVPQLADVAPVQAHSFRRLPGAELSLGDAVALAAELDRLLGSGERAGAVVTQGTDTLEEVAFALDLLVESELPVVVTGALRNPTLAGADGPANLLAAVAVAADPAARGLGALVVMNDEIHAARFVRKSNASNPAAFTSGPGPLGWVSENTPRILLRPPGRLRLPAPPTSAERPVLLVAVGLGDDGAAVRAAREAGAAGLVIEAFGGGHVPSAVADELEQAAAEVTVVLASRTGGGETLRATYDFPGSERDLLARGLISGGWLDGRKARVLLSLLLRAGLDRPAAERAFAELLAAGHAP
jgi:L-asparaginase